MNDVARQLRRFHELGSNKFIEFYAPMLHNTSASMRRAIVEGYGLI